MFAARNMQLVQKANIKTLADGLNDISHIPEILMKFIKNPKLMEASVIGVEGIQDFASILWVKFVKIGNLETVAEIDELLAALADENIKNFKVKLVKSEFYEVLVKIKSLVENKRKEIDNTSIQTQAYFKEKNEALIKKLFLNIVVYLRKKEGQIKSSTIKSKKEHFIHFIGKLLKYQFNSITNQAGWYKELIEKDSGSLFKADTSDFIGKNLHDFFGTEEYYRLTILFVMAARDIQNDFGNELIRKCIKEAARGEVQFLQAKIDEEISQGEPINYRVIYHLDQINDSFLNEESEKSLILFKEQIKFLSKLLVNLIFLENENVSSNNNCSSESIIMPSLADPAIEDIDSFYSFIMDEVKNIDCIKNYDEFSYVLFKLLSYFDKKLAEKTSETIEGKLSNFVEILQSIATPDLIKLNTMDLINKAKKKYVTSKDYLPLLNSLSSAKDSCKNISASFEKFKNKISDDTKIVCCPLIKQTVKLSLSQNNNSLALSLFNLMLYLVNKRSKLISLIPYNNRIKSFSDVYHKICNWLEHPEKFKNAVVNILENEVEKWKNSSSDRKAGYKGHLGKILNAMVNSRSPVDEFLLFKNTLEKTAYMTYKLGNLDEPRYRMFYDIYYNDMQISIDEDMDLNNNNSPKNLIK